jgi:hypothetical protein
LVLQDSGTCSPSIVPGKAYHLGAWYTSTAPVRLVLFYRTTRGSWTYLASSPELPSSSTWQNAAWTTPELPPDATRLSFGMRLAANGTMTVDDFQLAGDVPSSGNLKYLLAGILTLGPTGGYLAWRRRRTDPSRPAVP